MNLEKLYFKLPYFFQSLMLNTKGYMLSKTRYGKEFKKVLKEYKKNDRAQIDFRQLRVFLKIANKSSFWKKRFIDFDVDINSNDIINELKKLPILYKEEVKANIEEINIKLSEDKTESIKTSGTSGSGLIFTQTRSMENRQWAVWWRYREENGIKFGEKCAWFGGRSIISLNKKTPPFWHINYFMKQIMFSAYHLNNKTVKYYFKFIKKNKIRWLHGYPSQIAFFASLIKSERLGDIGSVKFITFGGENLLENQIAIIKEVFNAKLTQHYGLTEGVANISESLEGSLKPDQDFCYTEFIPCNNNIYKIIGTNYNNFSFPLIRYDTSDLATIIKDKIISIDGRNEDYITLPNGIKLGRLDHIFKSMVNIIEAQVYQPKLDMIIFRIVKGDKYSFKDEKNLKKEACQRFGNSINLSIKYVEKIERTSSGKLKFVISDLKNNETNHTRP